MCAVYVDDMFKYPVGQFRGMKMSHLIADTEAELFAMVDKIGVSRRWYQGDHFDIAMSKRELAIKHGAVEITYRQCGIMTMNRRAGSPMGTPETCEAIAQERRQTRAQRRAVNAAVASVVSAQKTPPKSARTDVSRRRNR